MASGGGTVGVVASGGGTVTVASVVVVIKALEDLQFRPAASRRVEQPFEEAAGDEATDTTARFLIMASSRLLSSLWSAWSAL